MLPSWGRLNACGMSPSDSPVLPVDKFGAQSEVVWRSPGCRSGAEPALLRRDVRRRRGPRRARMHSGRLPSFATKSVSPRYCKQQVRAHRSGPRRGVDGCLESLVVQGHQPEALGEGAKPSSTARSRSCPRSRRAPRAIGSTDGGTVACPREGTGRRRPTHGGRSVGEGSVFLGDEIRGSPPLADLWSPPINLQRRPLSIPLPVHAAASKPQGAGRRVVLALCPLPFVPRSRVTLT